MTYHQLGKSQLQISRIGFGCMSLKPGQDNIQLLIDAAINNGINYFDTADIYDKGVNEINIGKALKEKRKQILIATKVGNEWKEDGSGLNWNPTKKHILQAVEKSLLRLQTDYIDLYQLHGGTIEDNIDETIEAFELLQQQGKIRYYGISSIRPNVIREYIKRSNIVSVMMQYSLLDRRPEENCLAILQQHNIGVLARGSVAGGLLADKQPKTYLNYDETTVATAAAAIQSVTPSNSNAAATAISFVLQHPAITAAVVGIRTNEQLMDSLSAINDKALTEHDRQTLNNSIALNYYQQHR
jgi:aryl-alcohol dehydrogenase-like predicted oxidoreductase